MKRYRIYTGITVYFIQDWLGVYLWNPFKLHWQSAGKVYVTDDYGTLRRVL